MGYYLVSRKKYYTSFNFLSYYRYLTIGSMHLDIAFLYLYRVDCLYSGSIRIIMVAYCMEPAVPGVCPTIGNVNRNERLSDMSRKQVAV